MMPKHYRATITGNTIRWHDEIPPEVLTGKRVKVIVTVLKTVASEGDDSDDFNQTTAERLTDSEK